jgi:hypothetical protein
MSCPEKSPIPIARTPNPTQRGLLFPTADSYAEYHTNHWFPLLKWLKRFSSYEYHKNEWYAGGTLLSWCTETKAKDSQDGLYEYNSYRGIIRGDGKIMTKDKISCGCLKGDIELNYPNYRIAEELNDYLVAGTNDLNNFNFAVKKSIVS